MTLATAKPGSARTTKQGSHSFSSFGQNGIRPVSSNGSLGKKRLTSTAVADESKGAAPKVVVRPERFEIDGRGRIFRLVSRRVGDAVVRTPVGQWSRRKLKKKTLSQDALAALADASYLKHAPASPLQGDGDAGEQDEIRVADLFGGCGAMALGIREACRALGYRFRMVGAFEIEDAALAIYGANFGGPEPKRNIERILRSKMSAPVTRREQKLVAEFGRVDFVVAGPPCQGHSNLNNKTRRADPKNELYFRVARFARLFKPKWILIENVQAVLHDEGNVVARTRRALRKMGYHVDDGVVRVDDLGVAQTRRRHILFAVLAPARGEAKKETPTIAEVIERYRVPHRNVMWAIGDLSRRSGKTFFDKASVPASQTRRRIDWLFDNEAYELKNSQRPECQQGDHRYIGVYGRMRPSEPGPTITGGYDTMGRGRYVHPTRRRTITPHEAARIQFFPDWFDFGVVKARARLAQVIGNAVPPKLSYVFALELMR